MGHSAGTSLRLQRLSALGAIALVAVAVGLAFGRILVGHGATYRMIAVGVASGVIAWATERRGMLIATLASAAALLLTVTWLSVPHTTWFALPTATSVRSLATLATLVGAEARQYVSPAPGTPSLVMAGAIAVWAAVFSCYALAFRAQSPLLALVPPLALIVFADSVLDDTIKPLYGVLFLVAAFAVLFADSLRRIRAWGPVWSPVAGRDRLLPVAGRNARWVGASAVVVAALAPLLLPGFGTTSLLDISRLGGDDRFRVSPLVQMGSVLTDPKYHVPIFQVQVTPPGQHSYWQMQSLDEFDGNTWAALPDDATPEPVQNGAIPVTAEGGRSVTQTFTMLHDLGYSWLVAGGNEPTHITIGHDVSWHPQSSSLTMDGWPNDGEHYTVTSTYANPTADQLRAAGVGPVDAADLQLPTDPAMAVPASITNTAKRWTAGADTKYDEVMAIMEHLQPSHRFAYDASVDLQDSSQALADFLHERRGFCQQFAGLMAVMLRSLHIPARIGFGFAQGASVANEPGTYIVSGNDLHSWVEVPFNGFGYITFDPTPNFPDLSSTSYATPDVVPDRCPQGTKHCGTGQQGGGTASGTPPTPTDNGRSATQVGPAAQATTPLISVSRLALAAALLALLAAIAIPLIRGLRRRRRLHAAKDPRTLIIATYDVFADRARELGVGRAPGDTLDEFRDRLVATDRLVDADRPLARMTTEVVRAAYSAEAPDVTTAQEVLRDADVVLRALRSTTSFHQRLVGRYLGARTTRGRIQTITPQKEVKPGEPPR